MCLAFLVFGCNPPQPRLLLAFNRDEFFRRAAQPLHLWEDGSGILAGRDLGGSGGTWLGVNARSGRLALLTNLRSRDPIAPTYSNPSSCASRGELVTRFLTGSASPQEYIQSIPGDRYNGFNLIVGDLGTDPRVGSFAYANNGGDGSDAGATAGDGYGYCDRDAVGGPEARTGAETAATSAAVNVSASAGAGGGAGGGARCGGSPSMAVTPLEPGRVYGLGNGRLNQWPKVATGVEALRRMLPGVCKDRGVPYDGIFGELMGDSRRLVPPKGRAAQQPVAPAPEAASAGVGAAEGAGAAAAAAAGGSWAVGPERHASEAQPPAADSKRGVDGGARGLDGARGAQGELPEAEAAGAEAEAAEVRNGGGGTGLHVASFQEQLEHITSSRFVAEVQTPFGPYGTRSQIVIVVWPDGSAEARERHRFDDGTWRDVAVPFQLTTLANC